MLDLKKMLTKISKQMKEEFIFQDYECPATSISAGGLCEKGRDLHCRHIQVLTQGCVSCLAAEHSGRGCF